MKKKIVFLIVMLVLVVGAYTGYKYLYKDHRNIGAEASVVKLEAEALQMMFLNNATPSILNKTVTVSGTITHIEVNTITINDKVHCSFETSLEKLTTGTPVHIKGRCIGYDDLFEIVKLDQSTIIQPQ